MQMETSTTKVLGVRGCIWCGRLQLAASSYQFDIDNDDSFNGSIDLTINRFSQDTTDRDRSNWGSTVTEMLQSGTEYYWRYRPVGGNWSEVRTINVPLDTETPETEFIIDPVPDDDFFIFKTIADTDDNTLTLVITNDDGYDGDISLHSSQGSITPNQIIMNNGRAELEVLLSGNVSHARIAAIAGARHGYSNTFSFMNNDFGGDIVGNITEGYTGVTVTIKGPFGEEYSTITDSNGDFQFNDILCGEYTLNLSGETQTGERVRSLPEKVNVSCSNITYHTVTTTSLANCNPNGLTPVLLVPGILGSTITGTRGVYPELPATPPAWNSGELDLHNFDINVPIVGVDIDRVGWRNLREKLEAGDENGNNKYQRNCTIFDAPYYWANSSQQNARDYLKPYIDHAKQVSGQPQVDIIAHSMGGIVSRTYIQSDEYKAENDVRKFAMVGTPNQGSPLAYYIWENGNPRRADFNGIVSSPSNFILPNTFFYTNSLINFHRVKRDGASPCITSRRSKNSWRLPLYCNNEAIKDFVQSSVPGLKDLLPTYEGAIHSSITQQPIDYTENEDLINLNINTSILNTLNTSLFIGINKETIDSLYIDINGIPVYQGYDLSTTGDGTVPYESASVFGLVNQDKTGGHGGLPQTFNQELVDFVLK